MRRRGIRCLADRHQRGRAVRQWLRRRRIRTPRSRPWWIAAARNRSASSRPGRSCSISPTSSAPSCRADGCGPDRSAELAVLAGRQHALPGRRLRAFLRRYCAGEARIRDRPLCDGDEAAARRPSIARRRSERLPRRRDLQHRRYGRPFRGMAGWSGFGPSLARPSSCRCRNTRTSVAGRMRSRATGGATGPHGQPHLGDDPAKQLPERHDAGDFETRTQDKLAAPAA